MESTPLAILRSLVASVATRVPSSKKSVQASEWAHFLQHIPLKIVKQNPSILCLVFKGQVKTFKRHSECNIRKDALCSSCVCKFFIPTLYFFFTAFDVEAFCQQNKPDIP